MKKLISIVLLCAMLISCFAGCGMQKGQVDLNSYQANASLENAGYTAPVVGSEEGNVEVALQFDGSKAMSEYTVDLLEGSSDTSWYDASASEYTLEDAASVLGFFEAIQEGNNFAGKVIKLAANVDLNDSELVAGDASFAGTFDGQGYFISGINLYAGGRGEVALFGKVAVNTNAVIKNVSIINSSVNVVAVGTTSTGTTESGTSVNVGGFISSIGDTAVAEGEVLATLTIDNIYDDIDVYYVQAKPTYTSGVATAGAVASQNRVGGVVGWINSGVTNISNVVYVGTVESSGNNVAGLFGRAASTMGSNTLNISNCKNAGTLVPIGSFFVGGLQANTAEYVKAYKQGMASGTYSADVTVGETTYKASATKIDLSAKVISWGGVIGEFGGAATTGSIVDCENTASISGYQKLAGIVGAMTNGNLDIEGCINSGAMDAAGGNTAGILGGAGGVSLSIVNCENTATATIDANEKAYAGGILSTCNTKNTTVSGCINRAAISGKGSIGGIVSRISGQTYASGFGISLTDCTNYGNVTTTGNVMGGIIGAVLSSEEVSDTIAAGSKVEIKNCTVTSTLTGKAQSGGILGYASVDTAKVAVIVENCTFTETASINATTMTAGIFGYSDKASPITVKNCDMKGSVTAHRASGGIGGYWQKVALIEDCNVTGSVTITLDDAKNNAGAAILGRSIGGALTIKNTTFTGVLDITCAPLASVDNSDNTCFAGIAVGYANNDLTIEGCTLTGKVTITDNTSVETKATNRYTVINGFNNNTRTNVVSNVTFTKHAENNVPEDMVYSIVDPVMIGMQTRENQTDNTKTDLRLIAVLSNLADTEGVGFVVTIQMPDAEDRVETVYVTNVYSSINDQEGNVYAAADYYSDYMTTLVIQGVDNSLFTDGELTGAAITIVPIIATDAETSTNGASVVVGTLPTA